MRLPLLTRLSGLARDARRRLLNGFGQAPVGPSGPRRYRPLIEHLERRDLLAVWTVSSVWPNYVLEGVDVTIEFNRTCQSCADPPSDPPPPNWPYTSTFTIHYQVQPEPFGTNPVSTADYGVPDPLPSGLSAADYVAPTGTVTLYPGESSKSLLFHTTVGDSYEPTEYAFVKIIGTPSSDDPDDEISLDENDVNLEINDNDPPPPTPQPVLPGCTSCFGVGGSGSLGQIATVSPPPLVGPPLYNVKTLLTSVSSGGPSGFSSHPVRYSDGAVYLAATDLEADGGGIPWGVTRQWTNAPGYYRWNTVGTGMVIDQ